MIVRKEIDFNKPLTSAQEEMLRALEAAPDSADDEFPALSVEQLNKMRRASIDRSFADAQDDRYFMNR